MMKASENQEVKLKPKTSTLIREFAERSTIQVTFFDSKSIISVKLKTFL